MDLRQCLILISGHLTDGPIPAVLAESAVSFQMKISHSVAHVNICADARTEDCQSQGAGGGRSGERLFDFSEICHILVTLREAWVLLRTAAQFGMGCRVLARTSATLAHLGSESTA